MSMENNAVGIKIDEKERIFNKALGGDKDVKDVVARKVSQLVREETVRHMSEISAQVTLVSASSRLMEKIKKMVEGRNT